MFRRYVGCTIMAVVAVAAIYTSAVNNLGWVIAGHDLGGLFSTMGQLLGNGPVFRGYQFFLAVLLPIAVGAIALVPLDHFFQHALEQDHLDNHAVLVDERHMHRTAYLKAQRKQKQVIEEAYEEIAEERAQSFIEDVRNGDLSFGAGNVVAALPAPQPASMPSGTALQIPAPRRTMGTGSVWPVNR